MKQHMDHVVGAMLDAGFSLGTAQELFLDAYVSAALARNKDNVTRTAASLSMHRNTLHNIIQRRQPVRESMQRKRHKPTPTVDELRLAHIIEKSRKERR